jgi:predicted MFS family arabinose efflux permease
LAIYYAGRGLSLLALPVLLTATPQPPLILFIVFYGLDWVATVPPTMAICREVFGAKDGTIVFGWVFTAHQIGAAIAAVLAGVIRDETGEYTLAWFSAAALCAIAAAVSLGIKRAPVKAKSEAKTASIH